MQISFIFLHILLCSGASAAGTLKRGDRYDENTPSQVARARLTGSRRRRQDAGAARVFQNATAAKASEVVIVTSSAVPDTGAGSPIDTNTIPNFDFHPSSTVPVGSTGTGAPKSPSKPVDSGTESAPATTPDAPTSAPVLPTASEAIDTNTIPTFDFNPSSTVPIGSTASDETPIATTSSAPATSSGLPAESSPAPSSAPAVDISTIPQFDFHPSTTIPVGGPSNGTSPSAPAASSPATKSKPLGSATASEMATSTGLAQPDPATSEPAAPTKPAKSETSAAFTFSSIVKSSFVSQPVTATGKPDNQVPTVITSTPPTATSVTPEVMESNLADARQYNDLFSKMNEQSACSTGQVACIGGNIGKCSSAGAFEISPCVDGLTCYALPMNTTTGVQVGCVDDASAGKILSGGSGNSPAPAPSSPSSSNPSPSQVTVTMKPTDVVTSQVTVTQGGSTSVVTKSAPNSVITHTVEHTVDHTVEHTTTVSVTVSPGPGSEPTGGDDDSRTASPTTLVTFTRSDTEPASPSTTTADVISTPTSSADPTLTDVPSPTITDEPPVETPTTLVVIPITRTRPGHDRGDRDQDRFRQDFFFGAY